MLFTSESVSRGHPDKVADQISDAILDAILRQDPNGRVAVETLVTNPNKVVLAGEVSHIGDPVDYESIVRRTLLEIGYDDRCTPFNYNSVEVIPLIHQQSPDIAMGVDIGGAGDQGIMFGGAVRDNQFIRDRVWLPLSLDMSRFLMELHINLISDNSKEYYDHFYPDAKSQITLEIGNDSLTRIHTVVLSLQHTEDTTKEYIREYVMDNLIRPMCGTFNLYTDDQTIFHINPTGKFVLGGPAADTGLTGRKIIADTYGGYFPHGGGAFSGKDPTKVDRSAAYMARYLAKILLARNICRDKALVQLGYAIGVEQPVSVYVSDEDGFNQEAADYLSASFDLSPKAIIDRFSLRDSSKICYQKVASSNHFCDMSYPWEKIDQ